MDEDAAPLVGIAAQFAVEDDQSASEKARRVHRLAIFVDKGTAADQQRGAIGQTDGRSGEWRKSRARQFRLRGGEPVRREWLRRRGF